MPTSRSVCPYCGVGCGIVVETDGERVTRVRGDPDHPANRGRLCTKGQTCAEPVRAPGRLREARLRTSRDAPLAPCSTDAAIAAAAQRLSAIVARDGPQAVALYVSGQMSTEAQYLANKLAKGFIGTPYIESNSRLCMASAGSGYKLSLGADAPPGSYDDIDHADLFLVIGANMADAHPILFLRLLERRKAGARLVVVDPRRTATADKADLFLQIRPGTDLALLDGLLHLLAAGDHLDRQFIDRHTRGWDEMPALLADYPPARVADITGLAEADIRRAADWIAAAGRRWVSCWTMGLNQSVQGTWHTNALCNLHLATGAICTTGGGPFSLTGQPNAMGGREMGYMGDGLPGQRSAASEDDRRFAETVWALAPGTLRATPAIGTVGLFDALAEGRIKACWIVCTNPVASMANRSRVKAALQRAELVIVQDAFEDTDTTRYADVVLPAALWLEGSGTMINSERNVTLMPACVPPPGEALPDWQLVCRMAQALGHGAAFDYADAAAVFDEIRRFANPRTGYDLRGMSHARLALGPMQWPCPPGAGGEPAPAGKAAPPFRAPIRYLATDGEPRFATPDGRAVFWPRPWQPPPGAADADHPWVLDTGRLQHQWHTMTKTGKVPTLNRLNPAPFVEIHPQDAARLAIADGAPVRLASAQGTAQLPARVSDRVQPGCCFAPLHWGDLAGPELAVNALTSSAIDPVSQQPAFKYCAVNLEPASPAPAAGAAIPQQTSGDLAALSDALGLPLARPPFDAAAAAYAAGFLAAAQARGTADGALPPRVPDNAPLAAAQKLWLDGFTAAWLAPAGPRPGAAQPAAGETAAGMVLWASQTGRAEELARRLAERLGRTPVGLDAFEPARLADCTEPVLVVASSFGDGDAPDMAATFWDALRGPDAPRLDALRYAVLGLGDRSYDDFCGFARKLGERLVALGAHAIAPLLAIEADDPVPEDWLAALAPAAAGPHEQPAAPAPAAAAAPAPDRRHPATARLASSRRLGGDGGHEAWTHAIDIAGTGLTYRAGDALGVWPVNDGELVDEILAATGLAADAPVTLDGREMALGAALRDAREIARPGPELLAALAAAHPDSELAGLLQPAARADLSRWLWGRQVADLLRELSRPWTGQVFADALRPLRPRSYSIASSPLACPEAIHLAVGRVRYACGQRERFGVCSSFLGRLVPGDALRVFVQPTRDFHPPADADVDIVMIGPGTGIAPFRGFLQERAAQRGRGRNWLFFGERHAASGFYFRDELEAWQRSGVLARLDTAFSRDQADKLYVQHRILEQGAELWRWLEGGAHVYVCGDAARMASDVDAALAEVAARHGARSPEAARDHLATLQREKRYVRDVY